MKVVFSAATCLVSECVAKLNSFDDELLAQTTLICPTQRLGTHILARLSDTRSAFRAPRVTTLEPFVDQEWAELRTQGAHQASDLVCEIFIASLIRGAQARHLHIGHEHELKQLFFDLGEHQMGPEVWEALIAKVQGDSYRSEGHNHTVVERLQEIRQVHEDFLEGLKKQGYISPVLGMAAKCRDLLAAINTGEWLPQRGLGGPLFVVGFTTVKAYQRPLLEALGTVGELWFSEPLELMSAVNPLRELLGEEAPNQPAPSAPLARERQAVAYPNILKEVDAVVDEVRELLKSQASPHSIGVLVTNEALYAPLLKEAFAEAGVEANFAVSISLSSTPLGRWVRLLFRLCDSPTQQALQGFFAYEEATTGDTRPAEELDFALIHDLALHPGVNTWEGWLSKASQKHVRDKIRALSHKVDPLVRLKKSGKSPLSEWERAWREVLERFELELEEDTLSEEAEQKSSLQGLDQVAQALGMSVHLHDVGMGFAQFRELVEDKLLGLEVRTKGYPLEGVQVLRLIEARYIPFEHVFLLGACEGFLPKPLPRDYLVDDYLKHLMGLPGWKYVEALEEVTFRLLEARLPRLRFSYPAQDGQGPSRFLPESSARTGGGEQAFGDRLSSVPQGCSVPADEAQEVRIGEYPGSREDLFGSTSATLLESFILCPYKFLLMALKVESYPNLEADRTKTEGTLLHLLLEAFVRDLPLILETDHVAGWLRAKLDQVTDALMPYHPLLQSTPLEQHLRHHSWPRFAEHLARFYEPRGQGVWQFGFESTETEAVFGRGEGLRVARVSTERLRWGPEIRGKIDRIDESPGRFLITDYKRSRVPSAAEVNRAEAPQLILYALGMEGLALGKGQNLADGIVGYYSVLEGAWHPRGVGENARAWAEAKGLVSSKTSGLGDLAHELEKTWAPLLEEMHTQGKPLAPNPTTKCEWCPYDSICRSAK